VLLLIDATVQIKTKIKLYKILIRPVALYAGGTWVMIKSDERKLQVFERKILRKIFGPKKNNKGEYEILRLKP